MKYRFLSILSPDFQGLPASWRRTHPYTLPFPYNAFSCRQGTRLRVVLAMNVSHHKTRGLKVGETSCLGQWVNDVLRILSSVLPSVPPSSVVAICLLDCDVLFTKWLLKLHPSSQRHPNQERQGSKKFFYVVRLWVCKFTAESLDDFELISQARNWSHGHPHL